jgi:HPt (histidine-containing phosphotransfer) domain-containing protein
MIRSTQTRLRDLSKYHPEYEKFLFETADLIDGLEAELKFLEQEKAVATVAAEAVHELKKDINEIWFQRLQKAERRGAKWEELCHQFVDACCERDGFGEYSSLDCGCLEDHINNVLVEYERLNGEEG